MAQEVIVRQRAIINIIDLLVETNSRELHTEVVSTLLNASKNGAPPFSLGAIAFLGGRLLTCLFYGTAVEVRDEICRAGGIPVLLGLMEDISPSTIEKKEVNFLSELLAICVKLTLLGSLAGCARFTHGRPLTEGFPTRLCRETQAQLAVGPKRCAFRALG
jgi:hypothetical protein